MMSQPQKTPGGRRLRGLAGRGGGAGCCALLFFDFPSLSRFQSRFLEAYFGHSVQACVPQWCVSWALTPWPGTRFPGGFCLTSRVRSTHTWPWMLICCASFSANALLLFFWGATFGGFSAHQCLGTLFGCLAVCVAPFVAHFAWLSS